MLKLNKLSASIAVMMMSSTLTVHAQTELQANSQSQVLEEVVVTGIRGSLKQSLDVKRSASQVMDAISAEDVGKFPDTNIAEALQRITGVAIDRSGGEGQFITVRGLGPEFNTVLLNGRLLATDNDGREFSFDVISSDIIQRAEVFKSATPDLKSGGIGSVVNIATARPFDRGGKYLNLSVSAGYDTLREDTNPEFSAVGSWTNEDETFGVLTGASYSNRASQEDSVNTGGFLVRDGSLFVSASESAVGLGADSLGALPAGTRVQQNLGFVRRQQDRERITVNTSIQARPSETVKLTVDGLYSRFDIDGIDRVFTGFFNPQFINPVIDANGTVTSFSRPSVSFNNRNPLIGTQLGLSQDDNVVVGANRDAETYLLGTSLEIAASDNLTITADVSISEANRDDYNPFVVIGKLSPTSQTIQLNDSGVPTLTGVTGLTDTSLQRLHFVDVRRVAIQDEIFDTSIDLDWDLDRGRLKSVSAGLNYTDRDKSRDRYDNFSATQGFGIFCAYCGYTVSPSSSNFLSELSFDGFLSGVNGAGAVNQRALTFDFADVFSVLNDNASITAPNRAGRGAISDAELIARRDASGGSIFGFYEPDLNTAASFAVGETTTAAYLNTHWEGEFNDMPWSANIGFRIVETEITSTGIDQPAVEIRESVDDTQLDIRFGDPTLISVKNDYRNFLPSLNFKLEPTDNTVLRLGFSETITRPTLTALGISNTFGGRSNAPVSGGGNPDLQAFEATNYDVAFEWYFSDVGLLSLAGFHKEFKNFLESSTLPVSREIIFPANNPGNPTNVEVSRLVDFQDTRTRNGEKGSITGFEIAVQKTFDTLPAPFDGLGAQANYTYVSSDIERAAGSGASDCDYNGLSPHSLNLSGFYEKEGIQLRLAYNYRDEFLVQCFSDQSEPRQRESYGQLDFSAAYDVNETIQVFLEGTNLLDEDTRDFSRFSNRLLDYLDSGSRFSVGVRGNF